VRRHRVAAHGSLARKTHAEQRHARRAAQVSPLLRLRRVEPCCRGAPAWGPNGPRDEAQLVELAVAIAWEHFRARFNRVLDDRYG
jgi:hypothetical protein